MIEIIQKSNSLREVLLKQNKNTSGGNYKILKKYIEENNIDTSHFNSTKNRIKYNKSNCFNENSIVSRGHIKRRIIKEKLIDYNCNKCGLKDEWNNEPINLHLEHINGISNDNRLENLTFLCPNCHSQTKTYAGRNKIKKDKKFSKAKELRINRIEIIRTSNIDFTKKSWGVKVAKVIEITPQRALKFVKQYLPEFIT